MVDGYDAGSSTPKARRDDVVRAEKDRFGGIKWGSAFFGWLTAIGMTVLLSALATAIGVGVGAANPSGAEQAADQARQNAETLGIVGGIVLAVVLFVAYYCGGYVAGRMARFDGAKQGLAVWSWGIIVAILVAILAAVAGNQFNILDDLNGAPRIPLDGSLMTASGIIGLVIALIVPLLGAILGGKAGMRFHRKVDQAGIDHQTGVAG
ncbi:MFS family permease [Arthrobacter bambusae]|uniref:MFS family permease n=1 Tax=Arthrobacter bambusae TaxID=1338426 RepID=A0ABV2PCM9_9MICC